MKKDFLLKNVNFFKEHHLGRDVRTHEDYCRAITPPTKVVWGDKDWVVTDKKDGEFTLTPATKAINNDDPIKLPVGTLFTHVLPLRYD